MGTRKWPIRGGEGGLIERGRLINFLPLKRGGLLEQRGLM